MQRLIVLVYYKITGKYHSRSGYVSEKSNDDDVYGEVRQKRDANDLPGLDVEGGFCGFVVVVPERGMERLLIFEDEK